MWRFWSGRRDRLSLALIGVAVLSAGLSVMSLLTDSIRGTVVRAYEQTWRSPYDILAHMPLDGTPQGDLTEPNILTTLPPGITQAQLEEVRKVPGVEVAAPVAVVGHVQAGPSYLFPSADLPHPGGGIYRITSQVTSTDTLVPEAMREEYVVALPDPRTGQLPDQVPDGALLLDAGQRVSLVISAQIPTLLVGVDPEAEDKLVGLNKALTEGRYLRSADGVDTRQVGSRPVPVIPVLVNTFGLRGMTYSLTVEELDAGGRVKRKVAERTLAGDELLTAIEEGEVALHRVYGQSGTLTYTPVRSPHPDRWPDAFAMRPASVDLQSLLAYSGPVSPQTSVTAGTPVRPWTPGADDQIFYYAIRGYFDSSRLDVAKDPDSQLPLMTYRPAEALLVLDGDLRPVNPPRRIAGSLSPTGFLSSPPALLTTLEAARGLAGENAVNAIQVKVAGADHFTPEVVARVHDIAAEIERRTGLVAEVTMGSSPMKVLVQVPGPGPGESAGWIEVPWIHKDAAMTVVQQVEFGYSGYIAVVLIVGALYALTTALTGVTARRREVGVALAVGWPGRYLGRIAAGEQMLFAVVAGVLAAFSAAVGGAGPRMVGGVFAVSLVLYLPACIAAGWAAAATPPGAALRWGDTAPGRRVLPGTGILPLAISSLLGRPLRTCLTGIAIALPTGLITVLAFTAGHLDGVLYTTLTGQYAALKVGPLQFAAGAVALLVAATAAFDLIRQNAVDHRDERALLHALGWPHRWIAGTMVAEGVLLGVLSGALGLLLVAGSLQVLYGSAAAASQGVSLLAGLLPAGLGLVTGLLGSRVELRSWDRYALAGAGTGQVARFDARALSAAAAVLLAAVSVTVALVAPRVIREREVATAGAEHQEAIEAQAAIEAAVARQSEALEQMDLDGYLATLNPTSQAYLMEQRHWFEDVLRWRSENPNRRVTRSVDRVALLGTNTAHVDILLRLEDTETTSVALETVWVQTREGRWVEHGWQKEVLQSGDVVVWYPEEAAALAREMLTNAEEAVALAQEAGWWSGGPVVIDIMSDEQKFRASQGPWLGQFGLDPWTDYGEPIRLSARRVAPGPLSLYQIITAQEARRMSHNNAPRWLVLPVGELAASRAAQLSREALVESLSAATPMPLAELATVPPTFMLPEDKAHLARDTGFALVLYLEEQAGPEAVRRLLERLAGHPVDPVGTGPDVEPARGARALQALEQMTGKRVAELEQDFLAWWNQRIVRR